LQRAESNHYATLGLDRNCTDGQIRAAYRILARQFHPDLNPGSARAVTQTQALNAAYEILGDPVSRRTYDEELAAKKKPPAPGRTATITRNVSQEMHLRLDEFFRGANLEVRLHDPASANGPELYPLLIPPATAPGTRFKVPRHDGGFILVKVKARSDMRFKARGADLRCDLRITSQRATQGGTESVRGVLGNYLRIQIPRGVARGEVLRIDGEGLPKPRGGRGDLLVRVTYKLEARITRAAK